MQWIIMLCLGLVACSFSSGNKSNPQWGKVERGNLAEQVTIAGVVAPTKSTQIAAPYSGYIKNLYVKVGDRVKVGTPLVSVVESLTSSQPVFPMRAPINGIVAQINKSEGDFVREGGVGAESILRIDDQSEYIIKADTPEIHRIKVHEGQKAIIKVNAVTGKTYEGVIGSVARSPSAKESYRSATVDYSTIISLQNPDSMIYTGMSALVDLIIDQRNNVLLLRHEFVRRDRIGYFVLTKQGQRKDINVGMQTDEAFEVLSGVEEGDEVQMVDFESLVKGYN